MPSKLLFKSITFAESMAISVPLLTLTPISAFISAILSLIPLPLLIAVSVGASMCFASPFSTPPNALVMSAGRYTFMDYVKVGLPLQILMGIVMILVLPILFPF